MSGKGWEQRVRSSVCYAHGGLSSALGYKLGEQWCADLGRSLGNFTLVVKQPTSIPLLWYSAGKDVAVSRNSTRSYLPPGGNFELVIMMLQTVSFLSELLFLMLGGHGFLLGRFTHVYLLCAGALQGLPRSLSYLHHGIFAPLWL